MITILECFKYYLSIICINCGSFFSPIKIYKRYLRGKNYLSYNYQLSNLWYKYTIRQCVDMCQIYSLVNIPGNSSCQNTLFHKLYDKIHIQKKICKRSNLQGQQKPNWSIKDRKSKFYKKNMIKFHTQVLL